jgi:hypothetical protein
VRRSRNVVLRGPSEIVTVTFRLSPGCCGASRAEAHNAAKQDSTAQHHESRLLKPACAPVPGKPEIDWPRVLTQITTCPHSGTARGRAWLRLESRLERLHNQLFTPNLRWHAACTNSCRRNHQARLTSGGRLYPTEDEQRARHEGSSRCSVIPLLTTVVPLGDCLS